MRTHIFPDYVLQDDELISRFRKGAAEFIVQEDRLIIERAIGRRVMGDVDGNIIVEIGKI